MKTLIRSLKKLFISEIQKYKNMNNVTWTGPDHLDHIFESSLKDLTEAIWWENQDIEPILEFATALITPYCKGRKIRQEVWLTMIWMKKVISSYSHDKAERLVTDATF